MSEGKNLTHLNAFGFICIQNANHVVIRPVRVRKMVIDKQRCRLDIGPLCSTAIRYLLWFTHLTSHIHSYSRCRGRPQ
jgi:hypothetical protein